jgi:radical SAM superfamily enzyme YgiQ (UPF0313 family)
MSRRRRQVLLVQLPIPPLGPQVIRGNVPLAAGYLKLAARLRGLEEQWQIDILPSTAANTLGDQGLVEAILAREPQLVGFTCYLWNIDRTLWIAQRLKEQRPELRVLLGGPEVTADNDWVLNQPSVDFASIGEGEQTFAELLDALADGAAATRPIDGLYVREAAGAGGPLLPRFRRPMARLDGVSSPYLHGILDAADEGMLFLETVRGCIFKCKFCYYPKSYDSLYYVSREKIAANLQHAIERGAREVVLLDPTLNQRKDFADFLRLLAEHNPSKSLTCFGELRAEGITPQIAERLREANFTEVEVGLQSVDPAAMDLMERRNNLRAFERGVRAMRKAGIQVKVDLIIGLPGDTVESIRRGIRYLRDGGWYDSVQVFNLSVLPGTAFRQEAQQLGLVYSPRTPYYVLRTPTLATGDLYDLMQEAQDEFGVEFDPLPPVDLASGGRQPPDAAARELCQQWRVDLDNPVTAPPPSRRAQAFTLWMRSRDCDSRRREACRFIRHVLTDNPHTTLQIILEPTASPACLSLELFEDVRAACLAETSYLDRFYSILPGPPRGAKRMVVLLTSGQRDEVDQDWLDAVEDYATVVTCDREPGDSATSGLQYAAR